MLNGLLSRGSWVRVPAVSPQLVENKATQVAGQALGAPENRAVALHSGSQTAVEPEVCL